MNKNYVITKFKKHKNAASICTICAILYIMQILIVSYTNIDENEKLPILGFHNVVRDDEKEMYYSSNMWVESTSSFEHKIKYLYDEGYTVLSLEEVYEWTQGKKEIDDKSIVLTFDDGYYASSDIIAPILDKYGYTATTFVVGAYIEDEHTWDASRLQYLSKNDMEKQDVMKYASHTYDLHDKIDSDFAIDIHTEEQLQQDIDMQKDLVDTSYFAYPFGHYNETMIQVLKNNDVKLAFGYNENRKAKRNDNPYALPRFAITAYTNMETFKAMLNSK